MEAHMYNSQNDKLFPLWWLAVSPGFDSWLRPFCVEFECPFVSVCIPYEASLDSPKMYILG